jgi:hypothetical protein
VPDGIELASDEDIERAEIRIFDVKVIKFELQMSM